jgi:hypothetical protein
VNLNLAIVVDQAELPKFVHEEIHAGPCRSDHSGKRLLIDLYGRRFQTKVVAIIGQKQESPRQPHLAGIEQLVNQVRLDAGGSGQQMGEKIVGKLLVLMKQAGRWFASPTV